MQLCCKVKATVSRCVTVPDYIWLLNLCPTVITSSWLHSSCLSFLPQPPGFNFDTEALNLPGVPGAGAEQCSIMWWGGHTACQWHWSHKSLSVPIRDQRGVERSGRRDQAVEHWSPSVPKCVWMQKQEKESWMNWRGATHRNTLASA